jgi:hypothetical protein
MRLFCRGSTSTPRSEREIQTPCNPSRGYSGCCSVSFSRTRGIRILIPNSCTSRNHRFVWLCMDQSWPAACALGRANDLLVLHCDCQCKSESGHSPTSSDSPFQYSIYMATIDYMIAAYGPYSASATGGNALARDFLAGIAAMYSVPSKFFFYHVAAGLD